MPDAPYNSLTIKVYQGLSTTLRPDDNNELARAAGITYKTVFPYGLYGPGSFFIPRSEPTKRWEWKANDRVVIENGQEIVYEGKWGNVSVSTAPEDKGLVITLNGGWGNNLGIQTLNKPWADNRISEWAYEASDNFKNFDVFNRDEKLVAVTKDEVYINGHQVPLGRYFAPTGQTVKRITFDYVFNQEGDWTPNEAKHNDAPGGLNTFTDLDNTLDEDNTTFSTVTLTSDDYIYIGTSKPRWGVQFIQVDMGSVVNAVLATLSAEYSQGGGTWAAQSITDGTSTGGKTFAQDGFITFTPPKDWAKETVDSDTLYWHRFKASSNLTPSIRFISFQYVKNQSFKLAIYNNTTAADDWSVTSSGSGSVDETLGTADQSPSFYLQSMARQQGFGNGSVYAEISNIIVYTETGSITVSAIAADVHGAANELNSDTTKIGSNTLACVPFVTDGQENLASILERVTSFGDASGNSWNAYLIDSERAATPDGNPVLVLEQYPVLTDYDYVVSLEDANLEGGVDIVQDNDSIKNWIVVRYEDIDTGQELFITPDDDSTLTDSTSVADYGERHLSDPLDVGLADTTTATNAGVRFLAANKDPRFYVSSPITVVGYIRAKNRQKVPAANIRAGKRVLIEDFIHDMIPESDTGLIALITETDYNDNNQTCSISFGLQDDASIMLARAFSDFARKGAARLR